MDMIRSFRKTKKKKDKATGTERAKKKDASCDRSLKNGKKKDKDKENIDKSASNVKKKKEVNKSERKKRKSENTGPQKSSEIFDPVTFTFKFEKSLAPSSDNHTAGQKTAFENYAKNVLSIGIEGVLKEYLTEAALFIPVGFYSRAVFDVNTLMKKNRYKDVVCNDMTRVVLRDGRPGDYIHGNFVRGLQPTFILTQGPMKETINDFWRMVIQEKVSAICMLCEFIETGKRKCENYFPENVGGTMPVGDLTVVCESSGQQDSHTWVTSLAVTDKADNRTVKVTHYKITTWPDKTVAKSNLSLLRILRILRTCPIAVAVHCSAGIGRTGTLVGIEIGLQALLNEKTIKASDIVKALRHCRLNSVQMDTQYLMLSEAIIECGKSYTYIEDSKILEAFDVYKKQIAEYVAAHPPPVEKPAAPTPTADKLEGQGNGEATTLIQSNAPVAPSTTAQQPPPLQAPAAPQPPQPWNNAQQPQVKACTQYTPPTSTAPTPLPPPIPPSQPQPPAAPQPPQPWNNAQQPQPKGFTQYTPPTALPAPIPQPIPTSPHPPPPPPPPLSQPQPPQPTPLSPAPQLQFNAKQPVPVAAPQPQQNMQLNLQMIKPAISPPGAAQNMKPISPQPPPPAANVPATGNVKQLANQKLLDGMQPSPVARAVTQSPPPPVALPQPPIKIVPKPPSPIKISPAFNRNQQPPNFQANVIQKQQAPHNQSQYLK